MSTPENLVGVVRSVWDEVRLGLDEGLFREEGSLEAEVVGLLDHRLRNAFSAESNLRFVPQYVIHNEELGKKGRNPGQKGDLVVERGSGSAWYPEAGFEVKCYTGSDYRHQELRTVSNRRTLKFLQARATETGHACTPFFLYIVVHEDKNGLKEKIPKVMSETLHEVWIGRGVRDHPEEWSLDKYGNSPDG